MKMREKKTYKSPRINLLYINARLWKYMTCEGYNIATSLQLQKTMLLHQVKMQYQHIQNIVDTSIKHQISGQSTPTVKGCFDICSMW